jgi:hypothetical protein
MFLKNFLYIIIAVFIFASSSLPQNRNDFSLPEIRFTLKDCMANNITKFAGYLDNDSTDEKFIKAPETEECTIYLKDRSYLKNVIITGYSDNFTKVEKNGNNRIIAIDNINRLVFDRPSGFWIGAGIGAGISFVSCLVMGLIADGGESMHYTLMFGVISILPGSLVGGIIGMVSAPGDEVYDFSKANPKAKSKKLQHIINRHSILMH